MMNRSLKLSLIAILLFTMSNGICLAQTRMGYELYDHLDLSAFKSNIDIEVVQIYFSPEMLDAPEVLRLFRVSGHAFERSGELDLDKDRVPYTDRNMHLIYTLNDLKGYVHISDPQTALRYVRLHTSYETWNMWADYSAREEEIVPVSAVTQLPNFGLAYTMINPSFGPKSDEYTILDPFQKRLLTAKKGDNPDTDKWIYLYGDEQGMQGIVSDDDFRDAEFSLPEVKKVSNGFVVIRYTFSATTGIDPKPTVIRQIREWVGFDGAYKRTVLRTLHPKNEARLGLRWPIFVGSNRFTMMPVKDLLPPAARLLAQQPKPFADVPRDHWAYWAILTLKQKGILIGYPNGTFNGDSKR